MLNSKLWGLLALGITSVVALVLCPHSKVEESFNLQATHDLYYHGVSPAISSFRGNLEIPLPYDHIQFPGVVPRTFAGPVILAYILRLISVTTSPIFSLPSHPMAVQFLARLLLLMFNLHALYRLGVAAERKLSLGWGGRGGRQPLLGTYLLFITASQFHIPFYCSRMLPNVFALGLVVHAYAYWFDGRSGVAAAWIVVATAVFRCDVLILLFTMGLSMILRREMTIVQAIIIGVKSGVVSLVATVPLDSLLWGRLLWPEGEVLLYNTVENKSSEWGTSPWHWYASSAIPKAMLLTGLLVLIAFVRVPEMVTLLTIGKQQNKKVLSQGWRSDLFDSRLIPYLSPIAAFVALYSFLPHKEMRFIFPAIPMMNVAAAHDLERMHNATFPVEEPGKEKEKRKFSSYFSSLMFLGGIAAIIGTFIGSSVFLSVSRHNYPGGEALTLLHKYVDDFPSLGKSQSIEVHIDVASAMTGVSLFGQRAASLSQGDDLSWTFSKAGYEKENEVKFAGRSEFTHLLSEKGEQAGYQVVGVSQGFPRLDVRNFRVATEDAIFVHERDGWRG